MTSVTETRILRALDQGPVYVGLLRYAVGAKRSTFDNAIQRMQRDGQIEEQRDPENGAVAYRITS